MVLFAGNPRGTWAVKVGTTVQGPLQLYIEFKANLGYIRPCLKEKKKPGSGVAHL